MKKMMLASFFVFSSLSFANWQEGVFDRSTVVPAPLQQLILKQISSQCHRDFVSISELHTKVEYKKVKPEITESNSYVVYTSSFEAEYSFDGDRGDTKLAQIDVISYGRDLSDPYAPHYSVEPIDVTLTSGACY